MKVVLDTNVMVSALLSPHGPPAAILRSVLAEQVMLAYDARILTEYRDVLTRGRLRLDQDRVDGVLGFVETYGELVVAEPLVLDLPHMADAMFVEVAVAGRVDGLVTGNLRHFPAESVGSVRVISPRSFLDDYLAQGRD
ncbi:MAG: putative toxin-antitoxin system toxin component, PIN family [Gammaproteobacteria bacterium]|nr:putative toxin-antitoxin system toxin component, PIN family [Gammaproteobacteria bacterium]